MSISINPLLALCVTAVCSASTAFASVTLPFSTTYDCVEQEQADGTWVTCDGMSSYGGWTAANGGKEQITTAANYSSGGGGRGQRHWIGNGTNSNSGSIVTNFNNPSTEIYIRWYFRFQSGLQVSSNTSPHKMLYWNDCTGNGGGCYFAMGPDVVRLTVAGTNYDNGSTWGFTDLMGGSTSDGQWHWVELHVKRISGNADGTVEVWFDGTRRLNRTDVDFNGTTAGFDGAIIPENGAFVTSPTNQDNYEDIDDLAIRTTGPIGALSGGGGGALALFLSQGLVVATTAVQYLFVLAFLWERRATIIKALVAITLLKQYYWTWRYQRAIQQWQQRAPVMLEDQSRQFSEMPRFSQHVGQERRRWQ